MYVQVSRSFALAFLLVVLISPGQTSHEKPQSIGAVLCEDGHASCPVHSSTCCLGLSNKYFCCPLPNAVCCADGIHCCPQCFSCNVKGGSCLRPAAAAAAVRIYSLVPSSDKRIHTAPPTPPAAAAVAAAARQREIQNNKAAALAAAIARKKEAEEKEGFVAGVLSAVKLTLFSNGDDSKSKKSPQSKVSSPGIVGQVQKSQQPLSEVRPPSATPLKQPPLKPTTPSPPAKPPVVISRSPGILASAQPTPTVKEHGKISTQFPAKQPGSTQAGGTRKNQQPSESPSSSKNKETKEEKSSGFFSSVLSAVTDFYSGGSKEEAKSVEKSSSSAAHQQQQKSKQQLQQQQLQKQAAVKYSPQKQGNIPRPPPGQIPKIQQQNQRTVPPKQPIRTQNQPVGGQKINKVPPQVGKPQAFSAQANIKQQGKQQQPIQTGSRPVQTGQNQNVKQNIGISQRAAAAAIATQEKKAKAMGAKPAKKV